MIRPLDVLRFALSILSERKIRAFLTIIGIAIGPASMVTIIGTTEGYSQTILDQLGSLGENMIVVFPQRGYTVSDTTISTVKTMAGVEHAVAFYSTEGAFRRADGTELKVSLYATDLNVLFNAMTSLELEHGTLPLKTATTSGVLGYEAAHTTDAKPLYKVGDAVTVKIYVLKGDKLESKSVSLRICGLLQKHGSALVVNPDRTIFLPSAAGRGLLGLAQYTGIFVLADDPSHVDKVAAAIKDKYKDLVQVIAFQQIAKAISSVVNILEFLLFSLSISAFAVAVTGTMATMFTSIIERTREIGVLKALGFSSRNITVFIMTEGLIMSIIGGAFGVVVGTVGAHVLSSSGSFSMGGLLSITAEPAITLQLILKSLGMAVSVGTLGGLIPAYRASKVPPIVALRYE
ncbi:MAG: ABC transporter permease [Candidatus Bathyarchaeia archaeon]